MNYKNYQYLPILYTGCKVIKKKDVQLLLLKDNYSYLMNVLFAFIIYLLLGTALFTLSVAHGRQLWVYLEISYTFENNYSYLKDVLFDFIIYLLL